jgi:hypothetical protein
MLCDKYDDLMMKYMDGILDEAEESELRLHMESCFVCFEDFEAYSGILKGFNEMEIVEAPADFAAKVMERVTALDLYWSARVPAVSSDSDVKGQIIDGFISVAWVLLVFGLFGAAALTFFGTEILTWLEGAGLYGLTSVLAPLADSLGYFAASFSQFADNALVGLSRQSMILYSLSLLLVFVVLVVLQINMNTALKAKREKVKNYG